MKRVNFEVAKAIKEAGYPQVNTAPYYVVENCTKQYNIETITKETRLRIKRYKEGEYIEKLGFDDERCEPPLCYAPTYLEVWLWLWEEKKIKICVEPKVPVNGNDRNIDVYISAPFYALPHTMMKFYISPEESIMSAIEYLVDNDLIK